MAYDKKDILKPSNQYQHYDEILITFKEDGVAMDITNYIFTMDFRKDSTDGISVQKLVMGAGQLEIVDVAGIKKLKINKFSIDTAGKIFYDIRMKDPATGKVKYRVGGSTEIQSVSTKQDN